MADNISVVIPVYNSENALFELYQKLKKTLESLEVKFEIILIDDNSIDDSYKKIVELNNKDNRVKGMKLAQNFGQQNAIICGFNYVKYDYVITLDDDLGVHALLNELLGLLEELTSGDDDRGGTISNLVGVRSGDVNKSLGSWMNNVEESNKSSAII